MEPKRLSAVSVLGDDAHSRRGGSPSGGGLRALTASPRLSLMRSRRDSYETTVSGVSSCSAESRASSSCVSRHTSPDDCDRQRFIVWAAVLRNNCDKMSPTEKLECPLLRCRRRCESHESMLKHLYDCRLLTSGEYWCYECERPEMFTDVNCRKCTANHGSGRRRRIMSHAKNFFSSLGHKSRKDGAPSFADDVSLYDPPSLESLDIHPQQVELSSSTEIVEIDSVELPPSHHRPLGASSLQAAAAGAAMDVHVHQTPLTHTQDFTVDELHRMSASTTPLQPLPKMPDQINMWEAGLATSASCESARPPSPLWFQERSSTQVNTSTLAEPQDQQYYPNALQNNQLSHSLSLRSNGSAATTASNGISPASVYSAAWTMGSAWDTDVTSLSSGMVSPVGCLSRGGSNASRRSCFDAVPEENEGISELPADIPTSISAAGLSSFVNPGHLGIDQMYDPLSLSTQTLSMLPQATDILDLAVLGEPEDEMVDETTESVESLVMNAWSSLQSGVSELMAKLEHLPSNPLGSQLRGLGPQGIATTGLSAVGQALSGRSTLSSLEMMCFMHLADAFSTTLRHEQAGVMFDQSYLYSEHIPPDERSAFLEIVDTLWPTLKLHTPNAQICANAPSESLPEPHALTMMGSFKSPAPFDKLTDTSRCFLDELESSAVLPRNLRSSDPLSSQLWVRHWDGSPTSDDLGDNLANSIYSFVIHLTTQFQHSSRFVSRLGGFLSRLRQGVVTTIRRAELELIRLGKACFPDNEYRAIYVPEIHRFCDELYATMMPGLPPRIVYYDAGIALVSEVLSGLAGNCATLRQGDPDLSDVLMEELVPKLTPTETLPLDGLDFGDILTYDSLDMNGASAGTDVPPEPCASVSATPTDGGVPTSTPYESTHTPAAAPTTLKVAAKESCSLCGFRPKGHPRWFRGTMAKHMKNQHSTEPDKIYKCTFPGCKSEYRNRPDNLRQHQIEKGHLMEGDTARRPSKRKRVERPGND